MWFQGGLPTKTPVFLFQINIINLMLVEVFIQQTPTVYQT